MTTKQALRRLLEGMHEKHLRQVLDFARFVNGRAECDAWNRLALGQLDRAYGPREPEYTEADLKPEPPA